jgi:2-hydroxy-3-keto-5-methylthiopentenyl-1-phosphate phosphatase
MTDSKPASPLPPKILVQCDFDGTITIEDASFIMLDTFARGNWRRINDEYEAGRITVGRFNESAFGLVRATKKAMLESIRGRVRIRAGFSELMACCERHGFRVVIVSNGLDFYIQEIFNKIGFPKIEFHAASTRFGGRKVSVQYIGPDGKPIDDAFKAAYVSHFLRQNYRIIYIGDGSSDLAPARKCQRVFATGTLLKRCRAESVDHVPFDDFYRIVESLDELAKEE